MSMDVLLDRVFGIAQKELSRRWYFGLQGEASLPTPTLAHDFIVVEAVCHFLGRHNGRWDQFGAIFETSAEIRPTSPDVNIESVEWRLRHINILAGPAEGQARPSPSNKRFGLVIPWGVLIPFASPTSPIFPRHRKPYTALTFLEPFGEPFGDSAELQFLSVLSDHRHATVGVVDAEPVPGVTLELTAKMSPVYCEIHRAMEKRLGGIASAIGDRLPELCGNEGIRQSHLYSGR